MLFRSPDLGPVELVFGVQFGQPQPCPFLGGEVSGVAAADRLEALALAAAGGRAPFHFHQSLRLAEDAGDGKPLQIVCGAPNAREGLVGVFAPPDTYVPGSKFTLSVAKIRGVESRGMMCSERELELSDEHNGIIELPADTKIGSPAATALGIGDPVIPQT